MDAQAFKNLRAELPGRVAGTNEKLGRYLGVSQWSISNYQNSQGSIPSPIARALVMLVVICRNGQLGRLDELLDQWDPVEEGADG